MRQWQELFYDRNYSETNLSDNPDFVQVAQAFGIDAFRITRRDETDGAIQRLLAAEGPVPSRTSSSIRWKTSGRWCRQAKAITK